MFAAGLTFRGIVVWSKTLERADPMFWRIRATGQGQCMGEAFAERGVSALAHRPEVAGDGEVRQARERSFAAPALVRRAGVRDGSAGASSSAVQMRPTTIDQVMRIRRRAVDAGLAGGEG
ncbi:hypothetical protein BZL54_18160 [Burkholderia ubonensis subsp. mesacidophila]|uniref:Uncharacterized protein n=1 Tax=Burkholderia ubonensis subsp. mesacidophila TaxID=265293 RepID=A0A2A4FEP9_9BURK|nr:hypothetical protein BZL54_18160 [Burkholderia ubonensis subsp. mesacidophila]